MDGDETPSQRLNSGVWKDPIPAIVLPVNPLLAVRPALPAFPNDARGASRVVAPCSSVDERRLHAPSAEVVFSGDQPASAPVGTNHGAGSVPFSNDSV